MKRILIYGDMNLNVIDGSTIWLTSMAEALSLAGAHVDVLCKAPQVEPLLFDQLRSLDNVTLLDADGTREPYRYADAARRIEALDATSAYHIIITRGLRVGARLTHKKHLHHKLWPYLTDYPQQPELLEGDLARGLESVARSAKRILVQTEESRAYLEFHTPASAGKILIVPPMIPSVEAPADRPKTAALSLVYAGKFAKDWNTLEMCQLPRLLAERGITASLTIMGDKFQEDVEDPDWLPKMQEAITDSPGVTWLGAMGRDDVLTELSRHDIGLGWRSANLDASHELSTKLLEYMATGLLPLVNDTGMHRELLGQDYPLLVDGTVESVLDALSRWSAEGDKQGVFTHRLRERTMDHQLETIAQTLRGYLDRYAPTNLSAAQTVVVVSHDFKFCGELFDYLASSVNTKLIIDQWDALSRHSESRSRKALSAADTIFCEWCGPNAVWYSQRKRVGQRLIVRLHGFEARTGKWLDQINVDAIDTLICPSERYAELATAKLGINPDRVMVISNTIDVHDLHRPKLPDARFHLAQVGMVPTLKRPDRAAAVLRELLTLDDRYVLHLRGRLPTEYPWFMKDSLVARYYRRLYSDLLFDPELAPHVALDYFGPDIGSWLRRIGWVLGPSVEESFHLAPLEGMASGAVPVLWNRPGIESVYDTEWVHDDDPASIARGIHAVASDEDAWHHLSERAHEQALRFDTSTVSLQWAQLFDRR